MDYEMFQNLKKNIVMEIVLSHGLSMNVTVHVLYVPPPIECPTKYMAS